MGVTLVMVAVGGIALLQSRNEAWQQAETSSRNLMLALKRDIARNFMLLDLSLQGAQEALSEPGIYGVSRGILQHAVFDQSASVEDVAAVMVTDAGGKVILDSRKAGPSTTDLSQRTFFTFQRDHVGRGMFVSEVFGNKELSIAISRRLQAEDGRFAGVVVGVLWLDYFKELFQNLQLGAHGSLTLFTTSGRIVYRQPSNAAESNRDISRAETFEPMIQAGQGQFVGRASIDGVSRLYTFGRIANLPLVIAVNLSVDDIYAGWKARAVVIGTVLTLICLTTLGLTWLFYREVKRRAAAELRLRDSAEQLAVIAATDGLTGLGNRRTMEAEIAREWKRAIRSGDPLSLLMIDVDFFKLYNDRYGHLEGDIVLRTVSNCLREGLMRPADSVSRYGGEEFVALLPDTDEVGAEQIAERLRAHVEALAITHEGSPTGRLTVSIGVAVGQPLVGDEEAELLKAADVALYRAKHAGRNQVLMSICARSVAEFAVAPV